MIIFAELNSPYKFSKSYVVQSKCVKDMIDLLKKLNLVPRHILFLDYSGERYKPSNSI